jgi:hypothetical protein
MIMERELWKRVYRMVIDTAKGSSIKWAKFDDARIVLTYLWAVLHDRPTSWACCKQNWPIYDRRSDLPTPSTMTRRLRKEGVQKLLCAIEKIAVKHLPALLCRWIDAKPLPIGGSSGDKECGYGRAASAKARGYKLYAVAEAYKGFVAWAIAPMNYNEARVATDLISSLDRPGYLIGDTAYDSSRLYDLAASKSIQLVAPKRMPQSGLGHHKHSPYRLRSIELSKKPFGIDMLKCRDGIERMFGQLTTFGCGLKPLPNWVRTKVRVENWVRAKIIFYNIWRMYVSPNKI